MKELKEYLPYYVGAEVYDLYSCEFRQIISVEHGTGIVYLKSKQGITHKRKVDEIRLRLRPLSSMSEEEGKECDRLYFNMGKSAVECNALVFHYLLSLHMDIFGLIPSGLAIDITKNEKV